MKRDEMAKEYSLNTGIDNGTEEGIGLSPQQRICSEYGFKTGWDACEKEMEKLIPQLEFVKLQLEAKNARIDQLEGALKDIHVMLLTSTQVAFTRTNPEFTGECIVEAKKMIYSALYPEMADAEKALGQT